MTRALDMTPLHAWLLAIRPKTLPAAVAPVLVGSALAWSDGSFVLLPALAVLACALLFQIGANLANDYSDYIKGADTADRKGPIRVAQSGLIPLSRLRVGIAIVFAAAMLVGIYLIVVGGWPILAIGVASLVAAVAYTGGPFPYGYYGLGDLFVFLFFGLAAVCGTYYVQALHLTPAVIVAALPVGALTTAILVVNNLRDIDTDRQTNKRTLAVMIGPRATRLEYLLLFMLAFAVPPLMWLTGWSSVWCMLSWLSLPLAVHLVRTINRTSAGPPLNKALAGTARLDLIFSLLFALGLVI